MTNRSTVLSISDIESLPRFEVIQYLFPPAASLLSSDIPEPQRSSDDKMHKGNLSGVVVPMPTLPLPSMTNRSTVLSISDIESLPRFEVIQYLFPPAASLLSSDIPEPQRSSDDKMHKGNLSGVVVPMPTLPLRSMTNRSTVLSISDIESLPRFEVIQYLFPPAASLLSSDIPEPQRSSDDKMHKGNLSGVVVPMPTLPFLMVISSDNITKPVRRRSVTVTDPTDDTVKTASL
ncbi:MAG: hypothetical protein A4E54_00674 [Pelotomaculum sp. PtaB.Bin117]|nr:MAG: hypothetical protein A4E54_00674 [Pelotomaculum sp. PtaB.Bin117]